MQMIQLRVTALLGQGVNMYLCTHNRLQFQPRGALHGEFIKVLPVCACMSYVVPVMPDGIVWHVNLQLVYCFKPMYGALPCDVWMVNYCGKLTVLCNPDEGSRLQYPLLYSSQLNTCLGINTGQWAGSHCCCIRLVVVRLV